MITSRTPPQSINRIRTTVSAYVLQFLEVVLFSSSVVASIYYYTGYWELGVGGGGGHMSVSPLQHCNVKCGPGPADLKHHPLTRCCAPHPTDGKTIVCSFPFFVPFSVNNINSIAPNIIDHQHCNCIHHTCYSTTTQTCHQQLVSVTATATNGLLRRERRRTGLYFDPQSRTFPQKRSQILSAPVKAPFS